MDAAYVAKKEPLDGPRYLCSPVALIARRLMSEASAEFGGRSASPKPPSCTGRVLADGIAGLRTGAGVPGGR